MIKELLEQKKYWEQQLASTLNHRNNPFFRQTQWTTGMKKEDFDEQIVFEEKQIERIVNEIKTLTPTKDNQK